MKYRKLDENGDYTFGRRNQFLYDREAVGQAITTRLRLLLGEWWENTEDGLPLFQQILCKFRGEGDLRDVDLIISQRISGTRGVNKLVSYDSQFDSSNRVYSASCTVDTTYGEVALSIGMSSNSVLVKVV